MSLKFILYKVLSTMLDSSASVDAKFTQFSNWKTAAIALLPSGTPTIEQTVTAMSTIRSMTKTTYAPVFNAIKSIDSNDLQTYSTLLSNTTNLNTAFDLLVDYFPATIETSAPMAVEVSVKCAPCEKKEASAMLGSSK